MTSHFAKEVANELHRQIARHGILTTGYKAVRYLTGANPTNPRQHEFDIKRGIYTRRTEPTWKLKFSSPGRLTTTKYDNAKNST